jgi:hypothetical protein
MLHEPLLHAASVHGLTRSYPRMQAKRETWITLQDWGIVMNEQATIEAKRSHRALRGEEAGVGKFRPVGAKWIASRPTESGDYWFRSTEHAVPQVVTIKGKRVTFQSGKTKKLVDVRGQWGGVVIPPAWPMSKYSRSQPKTETWTKLIGKLLVGAVIGALCYQPYFIYVADEKQPEIVQEISPDQERISITVFPVFRNIGLKPGHIEHAAVSPRDPQLSPENVKLNYCNTVPISLLSVFSGKTIVCNFTATSDTQKQTGPIWFQVAYYGPGGHEIHMETYSAEPQLKPAH